MKRSIVILSITAALVTAPIAGWYVGDAVHAQGVEAGAESVDAGPELAVDAGAAAAATPEPTVVVVDITQTPRPPSPDDAETFFDTLESWWRAGRLKEAMLLALFGLLVLLERYVPWLQIGWRSAALAGSIQIVGDLVARAAAGIDVTVGMLQSAVFTLGLMFLNVRRRPKESPVAPPGAGAVGAGV